MSSSPRDLIIIGAGPSSLTTAVYTTRENIDTLVYEKGAVGGIMATVDRIDNYPGFSEGIEGIALAEEFEKQAKRFGTQIEYGEVKRLYKKDDLLAVEVDGNEVLAKSVLIASGGDHRKANVPGEEEYYGRGVHYCATCDGAFYTNRRIVVIGGGNSAVQEAMYLTKFASKVTILARSRISASEVLIRDLEKYVSEGKIEVHLKSPIQEIVGENGHVIGVKFIEDGKDSYIETDGVFVFIGLIPNTKFLIDSGIEIDEGGFIKTNDHMETSIPGVFASGDVRSGSTRQIASAAGEGVTAANSISEYLSHLQ
jgi:thioredoxin reductase (NADPH)